MCVESILASRSCRATTLCSQEPLHPQPSAAAITSHARTKPRDPTARASAPLTGEPSDVGQRNGVSQSHMLIIKPSCGGSGFEVFEFGPRDQGFQVEGQP